MLKKKKIFFKNDGHLTLLICKDSSNIQHKGEPNVNYGLWLIIIYQYWFISSNKYTKLMQDIYNGENWEGQRYEKVSVFSGKLFCKSKTALKYKLYLKRKKISEINFNNILNRSQIFQHVINIITVLIKFLCLFSY